MPVCFLSMSLLMRIIAGKFRGCSLRAPRGLDVRPTSDKLRETLFNVLTAGIPEALLDRVWLDLFAGTGAVGIEAISRGARSVYFVESSRVAAATLRQNLKSLRIEEGAEVEIHERPVNLALRRLDSAAVWCDFCFLDPPYTDSDAYEDSLGFLGQSRLVKPAGIVIAEHDRRRDSGSRFGALQRYRALEQGDAVLSFYRRL
jgi:16S rRNA (guanine966-N2)-methyltransferase